jgi:hypothetical protein
MDNILIPNSHYDSDNIRDQTFVHINKINKRDFKRIERVINSEAAHVENASFNISNHENNLIVVVNVSYCPEKLDEELKRFNSRKFKFSLIQDGTKLKYVGSCLMINKTVRTDYLKLKNGITLIYKNFYDIKIKRFTHTIEIWKMRIPVGSFQSGIRSQLINSMIHCDHNYMNYILDKCKRKIDDSVDQIAKYINNCDKVKRIMEI